MSDISQSVETSSTYRTMSGSRQRRHRIVIESHADESAMWDLSGGEERPPNETSWTTEEQNSSISFSDVSSESTSANSRASRARKRTTSHESTSSDSADSVVRRLNFKRPPLHALDKDNCEPVTPTSVDATTQQTATYPVKLFATVVIVILIAFVAYPYMASSVPTPPPDRLLEFFNDFRDVKESYKKQTTGFWCVLRAGAKPIIEFENPPQPAVFIIVVPTDATDTAQCLIQQFSGVITKLLRASRPVEFTPNNVDTLTPQTIKHQLDNTLNGGLAGGSRVAVIHHLERLPGESAMMLHSYCDNDNAPFSRAVFILTLHVNDTSDTLSESDSLVEDRLQTLWGEALGSNRFWPLMSRIANSIAYVRPETSDVLRQNKC